MRTEPDALEPDPSGEGTGAPVRDGDRDARCRVRRPFIVRVATLRKTSGAVRREVREGSIAGLGAVGVSVPDESPVTCDLTLSSYPAGIMVTGTVGATWTGECRRCGGAVSGVVDASVRERYVPRQDRMDDEDAYLLDGDELDLEPLVRDAVMLDLPLAPLCSADCRGLCPRCGENWNVVTCACQPEGDPRWRPLDVLRGPGGGSLA